jgi:hypothetical protein
MWLYAYSFRYMTVRLSGCSINLTAYVCAGVNINFICFSVKVSDLRNTDDQFSIKVMFLFKSLCVSRETFQWSSLIPHVSPRTALPHRLWKKVVEKSSFSLTTVYHPIQDAWDHFRETASSNVLTHKWPDPLSLIISSPSLPLRRTAPTCLRLSHLTSSLCVWGFIFF